MWTSGYNSSQEFSSVLCNFWPEASVNIILKYNNKVHKDKKILRQIRIILRQILCTVTVSQCHL